jgi:hypothetical protein
MRRRPHAGRCRQGPPLQSRRARRSCPLLLTRRWARGLRMLKPSRPSVSSRLTAASMFFSAVSVSRAIGAAVGRLAGGVAAYHRAGPRGRVARRGRAVAGLRARHRPSRRARAGRHWNDGAAPGGGRPRSPPPSTEQADLRPRRHRHHRQHAPALRPLRRQPPLGRQADLRPNHLLAGRPIYVQRRELDDARSEDDYTIREWV